MTYYIEIKETKESKHLFEHLYVKVISGGKQADKKPAKAVSKKSK